MIRVSVKDLPQDAYNLLQDYQVAFNQEGHCWDALMEITKDNYAVSQLLIGLLEQHDAAQEALTSLKSYGYNKEQVRAMYYQLG